MSIEIRKQRAPWSVRLLAALGCAVAGGAVAGGAEIASAAETASGVGKTIDRAAKDATPDKDATPAKPDKDTKPAKAPKAPRDSAEGGKQRAKDRLRDAVALEENVATTRWLARGAALIAFAACLLGLWWLSARWLRYRLLQWLALSALPSLFALAVLRSSQGSVERSLRALPQDALGELEQTPQVRADPEQHAALEHALALHDAKGTSLLAALALRSTAEIAGSALLLTLLLWQWTHRRVLQST
jgi:hypothetical protein